MSAFTETLHPVHLEEILEQEERTRIDLDKYHLAIRFDREWIIYRRQPNSWLRRIRQWTGTRRSIFAELEDLGIEPTREAEAALDTISERTGLRPSETDA